MENITTVTNVMQLSDDGSLDAESKWDIFIKDGKIIKIKAAGELMPQGDVIDGAETVALPGIINGHYHSHENFHKGRYDRLPLELWMNYVRPLSPLPLTSEDVYLRTLIGASQALLTGTTCIVDDFNASPVLHKEHVEAAFQAYEDIGIRALLGPTLFDVPFHMSVPFMEEVCSQSVLDELMLSESTTIEDYLKLISDF